MKKKGLLAIGWFLGTMLCLAGCGQFGKEEGVITAEKYANISLRIAWWGEEGRNERTVQLIREFEKQYPGLKVEMEYCRSADYQSKLSIQASGNDLPDVFQLTYGNLGLYVSKGQVMELDSLVEEKYIQLVDVDEMILAGGKYQGLLYGIPTGTNAQCMIYNPKMLEAADISLEGMETLSDYAQVCRVVYEKTGAKAHNISYDELFRSMGGDKFSREGNDIGFTAEMMEIFWTDKLKGITEGYYIGPDDWKSVDEGTNLAKGIIWCHGGFTNELETLEKESGLELELAKYPVADNAVRSDSAVVTPNMLWCIAPNTEHPELAAAFIDYFTNNPITYDICGTDRGIPISAKMRAHVNEDASLAEQKTNAFMEYLLDGNSMELNMNISPAVSQIDEIYDELDRYVRYQQITEEEIPALAEECVRRMKETLRKLD